MNHVFEIAKKAQDIAVSSYGTRWKLGTRPEMLRTGEGHTSLVELANANGNIYRLRFTDESMKTISFERLKSSLDIDPLESEVFTLDEAHSHLPSRIGGELALKGSYCPDRR